MLSARRDTQAHLRLRGLPQQRRSTPRHGRKQSPISLAATTASDTKALAWVAFALLLIVASLGFGMLALWLQRRQVTPTAATAAGAPSATASEGSTPAEQHFPIAIVAAHGLIAATTLVLALLAALDIGGS